MTGAMAMDEAGNELTAFHRVAEQAVFSDAPTPLALVAAWHRLAHLDRLLLVFNRYRQCWELPGGLIDPGETPRQAAVRELREESGLRAEDLTFAGYARFVLGAERRVEYAAVYALRVPARTAGSCPTPRSPRSAGGTARPRCRAGCSTSTSSWAGWPGRSFPIEDCGRTEWDRSRIDMRPQTRLTLSVMQ